MSTAHSTLRVFVSNLPYSTTETELSDLAARHGDVRRVKILRDVLTNQSRGLAFVECATADDAEKIIEGLLGAICGGRRLRAEPARAKDPRA